MLQLNMRRNSFDDMKLLCIGDSNTYGYDPRLFLGSRYSETIYWTGQLNGWTVFNFGMNGLSVPTDSKTWHNLMESRTPDLIIVMLGSNDLLAGRSAEETAKRMETFLRDLLRCGRTVLLIAPPVMKPGVWVQGEAKIDESRKLSHLFKDLADRLGTDFVDAEEWNVELSFDGVHFTEAGHRAFAQGLNNHLEERHYE